MKKLDIAKSEPGTRLAFIEKNTAKSIAETMVAFANTEGGTLVFGLREDGEPAKKKISSETLEKLLKEADAECNPPVVMGNWEQIDDEEKGTLYVLRIPRSIE
ncbi:MAG: ATP-binding protein, partial [Anaerolineae bacterium]|nr:ATP-binding protein [Anaerolineae bacterium]